MELIKQGKKKKYLVKDLKIILDNGYEFINAKEIEKLEVCNIYYIYNKYPIDIFNGKTSNKIYATELLNINKLVF